MGSLSDRREAYKPSQWGVLGEDLTWAAGFVTTQRLPGCAAHGETWVLRNDIDKQKEELEKKKQQLTDGLQKLSGAIEETMLALSDQRPDGDNEDDDGYLDDYERAAHMDLADREDPEVILEERQELRTELEEHLEEVEKDIEELQRSKLDFTWDKRNLPIQLRRLDKPWENFDAEALADAQRQQDERERQAGKKKSGKKKDRKAAVGDSKPDSKEEEQLFAAKLYESGVVCADDGRRFAFSDAVRSKSSLLPILTEGQLIMKYMWRLIIEKGKLDFESVGLLPIVSLFEVRRSHRDYQATWNAAFVSPFMQNGSISDVVSKFAGRKRDYFLKDELILKNLRMLIHSMGYLENYKIYHGNIKPSNIFVSSDGWTLCVGDFCPPSELKRWYSDVSKSLANVPEYISPELYDTLVKRKVQSATRIKQMIDFYKHDVFCMGMVFYYLTTMEEPESLYKNAKRIKHRVDKLRQSSRDSALIDLLESMLTYDAAKRPRWTGLMTTLERAAMYQGDIFRGLGNLIGWSSGDPEKNVLQHNVHADLLKNQGGNEDSQCSIM